MKEAPRVDHRWQFCSRCNHMMFEYYASADGHFGLASLSGSREVERPSSRDEVECLKCGARYRLLDRLDAMGQAVKRV
jgi:DNA-directed RNA polymerase subunit RPC12/RpoP